MRAAADTVGRLRKRAEFLAVAAGRRFHTERMTVQGLARIEGELRVGYTVTKRVGHATERNRIRRRLRAAFIPAAAAAGSVPLDIVVVGRRDSLSCPFDLLVADLGRGLASLARPPSGRTRRAPRESATTPA